MGNFINSMGISATSLVASSASSSSDEQVLCILKTNLGAFLESHLLQAIHLSISIQNSLKMRATSNGLIFMMFPMATWSTCKVYPHLPWVPPTACRLRRWSKGRKPAHVTRHGGGNRVNSKEIGIWHGPSMRFQPSMRTRIELIEPWRTWDCTDSNPS